MKLASLKNGTRDGVLVVVDKKLFRCVRAPGVAATLQQAIERWSETQPALQEIYDNLNEDRLPEAVPFSAAQAESPLPRAYQFLDGSVYLSHMRKAREARGAPMPPNYETEPLMYQGAGDAFLGPCDDLPLPSDDLGIDFEGEIAVILDDVPMGVKAEEAGAHVKLIMLLNDFTLRALTRTELPKGFGFLQAKPTSAFSPVAVTPDELPLWNGSTLNMCLTSAVNGRVVGSPNAGLDMYFSYPQLIAHAARTRRLGAGTILGAGTVANVSADSGSSCIAELRAEEEMSLGAPTTPFLAFGDQVSIEILDIEGDSVFGRIENRIVAS